MSSGNVVLEIGSDEDVFVAQSLDPEESSVAETAEDAAAQSVSEATLTEDAVDVESNNVATALSNDDTALTSKSGTSVSNMTSTTSVQDVLQTAGSGVEKYVDKFSNDFSLIDTISSFFNGIMNKVETIEKSVPDELVEEVLLSTADFVEISMCSPSYLRSQAKHFHPASEDDKNTINDDRQNCKDDEMTAKTDDSDSISDASDDRSTVSAAALIQETTITSDNTIEKVETTNKASAQKQQPAVTMTQQKGLSSKKKRLFGRLTKKAVAAA